MRELKAVLALCLFLLAPSVAGASEARTHDGFHMQLTTGLGFYKVNSSGQDFSGLTIPGSILLGGTIGPVAVGGGLIIDYAPSPKIDPEVSGADIKQFVVGLGLYGDFYLDPQAGGLHFQGFLGWGGLETSSGGNVGGSDPTGLVTYLGAGYEWFISDQWSAGVMGRLLYGGFKINGNSFTTLEPAVVGTLTLH
jgi:hypothetical protein